MQSTAFLEPLSVFLGLGLVIQIVQMIYNYRGIASLMSSIESIVSSASVGSAASIAIVPCRVSASSSDEITYTLNSLKRSLDLGYLDKSIVIVDRGDEERLINMNISRGYNSIKILISRSDLCARCSGKNRALITGLRSIDSEAGEVIVMLDCDAYHHPRSIFYASTASRAFRGVVTGYRWYLLRDIYSVLYNVVSSIAFEYMGISRTRIVWGGLTAMPLRVARDLGLEEKFMEELSDDAVIGREARRRGYGIVFCSKCISLTPAQRGFKNFYLWAVRQMIILRLYTPTGFKLLVTIYSLNTLILLLPIVVAMTGIPDQMLSVLIIIVMGYVVIGALRAILTLRLFSPGSIYPDVEKDKTTWKLVYVIISSLRAPLILSILITARVARRFTWRGIEYCIVDKGRKAVPCNAVY